MEKTVEEYIRELLVGSIKYHEIPHDVLINYPEITISSIDWDIIKFSEIPKDVIENLEICRELLKYDPYFLGSLPDDILINNFDMYKEFIDINSGILSTIPENIKDLDFCIKMLREYPEFIRYIPDGIILDNPEIFIEEFYKEGNKYFIANFPNKIKLDNPQICFDAVHDNIDFFRDVPKEIMLKNPKWCLDIVRENLQLFRFLPDKIKLDDPKMCFDAVDNDVYNLVELPEELILENQEKFDSIIYKNMYLFVHLSKKIMLNNQKLCIDAVHDNIDRFRFLPKEVMLQNQEFCLDILDKDPSLIRCLPEEIIFKNKDFCLDIIKDDIGLISYFPKEIMLENKELCLDAVYKYPEILSSLPDEFILEDPEMCMDIMEMDESAFYSLSDEIMFQNPQICAYAIYLDSKNMEFIPEKLIEEKPEIFLKALDYDEYVYKDIPREILEKNKQIDEYMFGEDLERFYDLRRKGNYNLSVEAESIGNMNVFYHKMIKSIGIDEVEKLVEVPSFSKEELERYQLQYDEKFDELFDKKYVLKGDTEALVKIFNSIDLRGYETKGKNVKFEVFKNINKILEEENDISLVDLVNRAITDSGLEVDSKVIEKLNSNKKSIVNSLAEQRFDKVRNELLEKLNAGLTSQQPVVSRIIESKIKASMADNDGRINVDDVLSKIEGELNRTRDNGGSFYSPHVLHQREQIKNIATEFLTDKNIEKKLSKSLVTIMKEKKSDIGKGWIRKVQGVPLNLNKDEYEKLEEKLGIKLDATYKTILKEGGDEKEAYKLLAEKQIPGVVTFNQVEIMFSNMKKPYSEEFKNFYKKNKEEILQRPEVYTKLAQMHNEFDNIINKPGVINRYNSGEITLDDFVRMLDERKYDDIRDGNERLAINASEAGLTQNEFYEAQRVFETTSKREGTSIPQVNAKGKKFRGRMLRADDAINLFAGNITTCCQKFGDVGEGAMLHGSTEKNGGIFVVEELDEIGKVKKVVGQSWTWRNKDRVCFDNIEISNVEHERLSAEDEKEIMDIYITAGKNAIETDQKVMDKLLKEGKINQQVYDAVVLKDVTVGLNQYNDLGELEKRIKDGTLKDIEEIVLPKEAEKTYRGINNNKPWIDSSQRQIVLAKMDDKKREEIDARSKKRNEKIEYDEPVVYKNAREVDEYVGKNVIVDDIEKIKKIERVVYRKEQQVLQGCGDIVDVAQRYNMDEDKIEITMSKDGDWYMIGEEYDNEYYVADLAMVGGVNSQSNEKIDYNAKIATFEIAEKMYEKMIEMGKKEKNIRYEATRDTSYINTLRMTEKGLGEIVQDEEDRFNDTEIEMNNVVLKPNVEKLEEELKKIREILSKVRKREQQKVVEAKKEDVDDISI